MAHVLEFTIEGLAGRPEPFSAVLNRDVNVFFGLNGSGKTTLLKILYSALSTDTEILKDLPFTRASVKIYLNRHSREFVRTIVQKENVESSDVAHAAPDNQLRLLTLDDAAALGHKPTGRLSKWFLDSATTPKWSSDPPEPDDRLTGQREGFLPISRLYRNVTTPTGTRRLSDQELDSAFAKGLQAKWTEYYADISKAITQVQERGFANILGFFLSGQVAKDAEVGAPDEKEAYKRIAGFLRRQPGFAHLLPSEAKFGGIYAQRPELRNVVKQIETVERQIDSISAPREKFREVLESMFTGSKHLVFTEKEIQVQLSNLKPIGLSLLSSGEKQLLFIALHALIGATHSLIIDEPELSMHVDWQKKLISTLRELNPNIQQIMATHSPEIMAELPDNRVFRI